MDTKYFYIIQVLDQNNQWYNNAFIENDYDAIRVAKFYKDELGYFVKLIHEGRDMTQMLDSVQIVRVRKE